MKNRKEYQFQKRDSFWQKTWEEKKVFQTSEDDKKPKKYVMDMLLSMFSVL